MKANAPEQDGRQDAAARLREWITGGRFMPNERLIETDLAEALGVNRANVRMALAMLEQEGLVVRERNRGARVRLVSDAEAIEIAEARQSLEALVARQAAAFGQQQAAQPTRKSIRVPQLAELLPSRDERLLRGIFGQVDIMQSGICAAERQVLKSLDQFTEGFVSRGEHTLSIQDLCNQRL